MPPPNHPPSAGTSVYQAVKERLWGSALPPTEATALLPAQRTPPSYSGPSRPMEPAKAEEAVALLKSAKDLEAGGPKWREEDDGHWGKLSKDWASAAVICCVVLLGDSARGIMFPTLWPRVAALGGNRTTHGYMVGSFSLGRAISSPFIGQWSGRFGFKNTLAVCSLVIALGGTVYALADSLTPLFIGQVLIGVGSGSLGVTRAYVAELSSPAARTVLLAYLTAVQYCGFTCTPFIGALLSMIFGGEQSHSPFDVDEFNAPGYFTAVWALVSCAFLVCVFQEPDHSRTRMQGFRDGTLPAPSNAVAEAPRTPSPATVDDASEDGEEPGCFDAEEPVLFSLLFLNVATKGSISCFETLGAMFAMVIFDFSVPSAGQLFAGCGAVGVLALLAMRPLTRCFDEVQLILGGIGVMAAASLMVAMLERGSPVIVFYMVVFFMYAVGYPIGHTAVIGVFSQVAEGKSQGTLLSWFGTAGSLARIFFPFLSGFVAQTLGFSAIFTLIAAVLICTFVSVLYGRACLRKHMNRQRVRR